MKSINAGVKPEDIKNRFCEAYDNIMEALGIPHGGVVAALVQVTQRIWMMKNGYK